MSTHTTPANSQLLRPAFLTPTKRFPVYPQRWLNLLYLSLLNFLSDWHCYSLSPLTHLSPLQYPLINPTSTVSLFLFCNFLSTCITPWLLRRLGLRFITVLGSFLLLFGSMIKSGLPFFGLANESSKFFLLIGTSIIGFSQPLYQCTPIVLSSVWFPPSERTLSTSLSLNSNQLGIGFSFLFGSLYVSTPQEIPFYFALLTLLSLIIFVLICVSFVDKPPRPPSETAKLARDLSAVKRGLRFGKSTSFLTSSQRGGVAEVDVVEFFGSGGGEELKDDDNGNDNGGGGKKASLPLPSASSKGLPPRTPGNPTPPQQPTNLLNLDTSFTIAYLNNTNDDVHEHGYMDSEESDDENDSEGEPILTKIFNPKFKTPGNALQNPKPQDPFVLTQYPPYKQTILQSLRNLKFPRNSPGFFKAFLVFSVSSIVINTLSASLSELILLDEVSPDSSLDSSYGSDEEVVLTQNQRYKIGLNGLSFQLLLLFSSFHIANLTDKLKNYVTVTSTLLFLGSTSIALTLYTLASSVDGGKLGFTVFFLFTSVFIGPLQPVSTEYGVEVSYDLKSDNQNLVLVLFQLGANLGSSLFITIFEYIKPSTTLLNHTFKKYTLSYALLLVLVFITAVYFSVGEKGRMKRHEEEERRRREYVFGEVGFQRSFSASSGIGGGGGGDILSGGIVV